MSDTKRTLPTLPPYSGAETELNYWMNLIIRRFDRIKAQGEEATIRNLLMGIAAPHSYKVSERKANIDALLQGKGLSKLCDDLNVDEDDIEQLDINKIEKSLHRYQNDEDVDSQLKEFLVSSEASIGKSKNLETFSGLVVTAYVEKDDRKIAAMKTVHAFVTQGAPGLIKSDMFKLFESHQLLMSRVKLLDAIDSYFKKMEQLNLADEKSKPVSKPPEKT